MLRQISGRTLSVITGFTIVDTAKYKMVSKAVTTKVYINKLTNQEINNYVRSKEPLDKSGAFAIQGLGAVIVKKIEGDFFNVIGLPLYALAQELKRFDINML